MHLGIDGKLALVLAASRGLGRGVAQKLAAEGAHVVLVGRDQERLEREVSEINGRRHGRASSVRADLSNPKDIDAVIAHSRDLGGADILINNSGGPRAGAASAVQRAEWEAEFAAMATPIFEVTRHVVVDMRKKSWGRIITIASSGVVQPIPNLPVSNALRASIVAWSKTLATEVAPDGITCNVVLPGRIATDRVAQLDQLAAAKAEKSLQDIRKASWATIPIGRYGEVQEFASVVAFLASQPASYVTGSIVRVDGGMIRSI